MTTAPENSKTEPADWRVMRQDDNGNRFVVQDNLTEAQAKELARLFEKRGHKQTYWAEQKSQE